MLTSSQTIISSATFVGLLTNGATVGQLRVEIYFEFCPTTPTSPGPAVPRPSQPLRFPPGSIRPRTLSSTIVIPLPATYLSQPRYWGTFTAYDSVLPGRHCPPTGPDYRWERCNHRRGGAVQCHLLLSVDLPQDHYFCARQVEIVEPAAFFWLSATTDRSAGGTPFPAGCTDLQAWTRDQFLDPGLAARCTDIAGARRRPPST